jgi:hypothetical protein
MLKNIVKLTFCNLSNSNLFIDFLKKKMQKLIVKNNQIFLKIKAFILFLWFIMRVKCVTNFCPVLTK